MTPFGLKKPKAMDNKEKKELSESDIKAKFITPAVIKAGWEEMTQIRREVTLTPGPVVVRGNLSSRNKKKKKFTDYVLQREKGVPIAVIEAKDNNHTVSDGMQQALCYGDIAGSTKQTTNLTSINKTQLRGCLIAVPPKNQKEAILLKLEETTHLCSELKSNINKEQTLKLTLSDSITTQIQS